MQRMAKILTMSDLSNSRIIKQTAQQTCVPNLQNALKIRAPATFCQ